ncbi:hypothetical protein EON62_04075 [archaeon]|nr:MAG: hypothetical protein EON62_04075 [archaeon]
MLGDVGAGLQIPEQCRLPMTATDLKTGLALLKEDFIRANPEWTKVRPPRARVRAQCLPCVVMVV